MIAPEHPQEARRIAALKAYDILDSLPEADYDDLVRIAASVCGTSLAAITLIDTDRQWFKSAIGVGEMKETTRETAMCAHAILDETAVTVVLDPRQDRRFADNPFVTDCESGLQFYAGAPILAPIEGLPLGTICVADTKQRSEFTPDQQAILTALSRQVGNLLALRRSRAELALANAKLAELAETDMLTGLANRRAFESRLGAAIDRAMQERESLSLLMIDIDHFKRLNDTYGHAVGDTVLQNVATTLTAGCRLDREDFIARIGGEEFVAILPKTTLQEATLLAERLCRLVAAGPSHTGPTVTISAGAASLRHEACGTSDAATRILAAADRALYQAKNAGRNRVVVASEDRELAFLAL